MDFPNDPFNLLINFNNPDDADEVQKNLDEFKEISIKVVEMSQTEGFKHFMKMIEDLEKTQQVHPVFYSQDPALAHKHAGALSVLKVIKEWPDTCIKFLDQYGKEKQKQ